jgi:hypothetical protein
MLGVLRRFEQMKRVVVLRLESKIVDIVLQDLSGFVFCHLRAPRRLLMSAAAADRIYKSVFRE